MAETLEVSRRFEAPRHLVFTAWRTAEHLERWFAPKGCIAPEARVEFHADGVFDFLMRATDGTDYWMRGRMSLRQSCEIFDPSADRSAVPGRDGTARSTIGRTRCPASWRPSPVILALFPEPRSLYERAP